MLKSQKKFLVVENVKHGGVEVEFLWKKSVENLYTAKNSQQIVEKSVIQTVILLKCGLFSQIFLFTKVFNLTFNTLLKTKKSTLCNRFFKQK